MWSFLIVIIAFIIISANGGSVKAEQRYKCNLAEQNHHFGCVPPEGLERELRTYYEKNWKEGDMSEFKGDAFAYLTSWEAPRSAVYSYIDCLVMAETARRGYRPSNCRVYDLNIDVLSLDYMKPFYAEYGDALRAFNGEKGKFKMPDELRREEEERRQSEGV